MKRARQLLLGLLMVMTFMTVFTPVVHADPAPASTSSTIGICTFIPQICKAISGNSNTLDTATSIAFAKNRISTILSFVFIGIILISVFIIVRAGIVYIQSQGASDKIEEAKKAITNVFIGIAVLFVGIIGIVIVLAFFNLSSVTSDTCTIDTNTGKLCCPNASDPAHPVCSTN